MEKRKLEEESYGGEAPAQEAESPNPVQAVVPTTTGDKGKRRAIVATQIGSYFKERTTPGSQLTLKSVLASKEIVHKTKLGLAKWIIDARIPFNAIQLPYFQPALDGVAATGPGFKGPSYDEMRVHLLADLKIECQLLVEKYRSSWKSTGCTLMTNGWTDQRQQILINFLVYCPTGTSFVKTVDASDVIKTTNALFNLFANVIEWVGPSNIVHMVTDNAANYILQVFLTQLTLLPVLQNIYDHKEDLQALMVDKYFTSHKLAKSANGKIVSSIVLDSKFWQDCVTTVKI
ncbi:hypothetical protein S245_066722, partial [Arachis hypogaea]